MSIAFVLGNGRSRLAVDLDSLRPHGKIYGCNALYRTFAPDVLVATDPEISTAIMESGYAAKHEFYTRKPIQGSGAKLIRKNYGFSSGPIALTLAIDEGHEKIFMIGFDLNSSDGKFNNVYAGTEFYKEVGAKETFWGNWENQISEIIKNCGSQVIRVNESNIIPKKWQNKLLHVSMQAFQDAININKLEAL